MWKPRGKAQANRNVHYIVSVSLSSPFHSQSPYLSRLNFFILSHSHTRKNKKLLVFVSYCSSPHSSIFTQRNGVGYFFRRRWSPSPITITFFSVPHFSIIPSSHAPLSRCNNKTNNASFQVSRDEGGFP